MGKKYERAAADVAAQLVIDQLLNEFGYSVRHAAELSQGALTYSRIHDLRNGNKTPIKLSETIALAHVFHMNVEDFASLIYEKAQELEEEAENSTQFTNHEDYGLVADTDPNKDLEMNDFYD